MSDALKNRLFDFLTLVLENTDDQELIDEALSLKRLMTK